MILFIDVTTALWCREKQYYLQKSYSVLLPCSWRSSTNPIYRVHYCSRIKGLAGCHIRPHFKHSTWPKKTNCGISLLYYTPFSSHVRTEKLFVESSHCSYSSFNIPASLASFQVALYVTTALLMRLKSFVSHFPLRLLQR